MVIKSHLPTCRMGGIRSQKVNTRDTIHISLPMLQAEAQQTSDIRKTPQFCRAAGVFSFEFLQKLIYNISGIILLLA